MKKIIFTKIIFTKIIFTKYRKIMCLFLFFLFPFLLNAYASFEQPWGKDSEICYANKKKIITKKNKKLSLLTKVADKVILFKQKFISPIDGPRSHFRPTSSKYMQLAMYKYGFFKGYIMGCDRLLRENDEKWVYRTITINNITYKYDPANTSKYRK